MLGKPTFVDVYAVVATGALTIKGATVLLHGRAKDGSELPYSPLKPENDSVTLAVGNPWQVPIFAVKSKLGAFSFRLPYEWTERDRIELEAELVPPKLYGKAECTPSPCSANNRFRLANLAFYDTGYVEVWALAFTMKNGPQLDYPFQVFQQAADALPVGPVGLEANAIQYYASYTDAAAKCAPGKAGEACRDAVDENNLATVKAFVSDLPSKCANFLVSLRPKSCPDVVAGVTATGAGLTQGTVFSKLPRPATIVVNQSRPLTSVSHETGHALGFLHADTAGGGSSKKAGGSESWWPEPWGLLYGIMADGHVNGAGNVGTVGAAPSSTKCPAGPAWWFDFMSYCASTYDTDSWISIINYRRAFSGIRTLQKLRTSSYALRRIPAQQRAVLSVIGYVEGDAAVVTRIRPKAGEPQAGPADSPYRLVLLDAVGRVLAEAPMLAETATGSEAVFLSADVLLADTAAGALPQALYAVEIASAGRGLARVVRSRNAPAVEFLAPTAGARVGGGRPVSLRWSARDADGDALTASVDYSTDDGATWQTVAGGVTDAQVSLPSGRLTASDRARVRIRASDGLNETAAVSDRFVSLGAPPFVRITTPARRVTIGAVQPLSLAALAYDDAFQRLRGRALTWFDGRRRIAFGEAATVAPLAPGLHTIGVVARDRLGRSARASVAVLVRGVAPRLIVRGAPARLSPRAGAVRLVLAATTPALVTAAGPSLRGRSPRWRVGTQARAISVPVKPGAGPVRIVLRATAFGRTSALRLTVPRSR